MTPPGVGRWEDTAGLVRAGSSRIWVIQAEALPVWGQEFQEGFAEEPWGSQPSHRAGSEKGTDLNQTPAWAG